MRIIGAKFVTSLIIFAASGAIAQEIWTGKDGSVRGIDAKAVFMAPGALYLATKDTVYRAKDDGAGWTSIFMLTSGETEINCMGGRNGKIFIGTTRGIFRSDDEGGRWKNVFKTIVPEKNHVNAMNFAYDGGKRIIVGTEKGIFTSSDGGDRWSDVSGVLKNVSVRRITVDKTRIYAAAATGLYVKKDDQSDWERLLIKSVPEEGLEAADPNTIDSQETEFQPSGCVVVKGGTLYASIGKVISYSTDGGMDWRKITKEGLHGYINSILPSSKGAGPIYCSTTKGVFELAAGSERWLELYKGKTVNASVSSIIFDGPDEKAIWAVTDKGLCRFESERYAVYQRMDVEKSIKTLKTSLDAEPPFKELQQAAIRYADVSPEKIKAWQREARLKALLPTVSIGTDKRRSTNTEIYTSATKDYAVIGPDDTSIGWDLSISWDLTDIIWSYGQTNIDVRSRLMVQLRNDILDDLRRVYYERRRLQYELMTEGIGREGKERYDKELRMEELTQAIDDLTGNYFSENFNPPDKSSGFNPGMDGLAFQGGREPQSLARQARHASGHAELVEAQAEGAPQDRK